MSYLPTIRELIQKSNIQPLKDMVKEIDTLYDSEQQEWTLALQMVPDRDTRKVLDKAHNAELAAERQTSDGLGKLNDELHGQLLSTQAAIEKKDEALEHLIKG